MRATTSKASRLWLYLLPRSSPHREECSIPPAGATRWSPSPTVSAFRSASCAAGTTSQVPRSHLAAACMSRSLHAWSARRAIATVLQPLRAFAILRLHRRANRVPNRHHPRSPRRRNLTADQHREKEANHHAKPPHQMKIEFVGGKNLFLLILRASFD